MIIILIKSFNNWSSYCPGGCNIDGEEESWDFGTGAGFYIDATTDKWKTNYRMYSYVTKEVSSGLRTINIFSLISKLQMVEY